MTKSQSYAICSASTTAQKQAIYRFRFDIFGREMGLLGSLDLWEEPSFHDELDEQSYHFFAESDGIVVGSIRITHGKPCATSEDFLKTYELNKFLTVLPPEKLAVATRLMVSSRFRGSNLSLRLMKRAAEYCIDQGVECVFIDCQPHLVPLYQRFGFRPYRTVFNDPYVGVLMPLVIIISDFDYLQQVRTPLWKIISTKRQQVNPNLVNALNSLIDSAPSIITEEHDGKEFFLEAVNGHLRAKSKLDEKWGFLEGLSSEDINTLVHGSYLLRCKKGAAIIHTNHATETMFLIIEGVLEFQEKGESLGFIGKGGVVGEFAYLVNISRTANIMVASEGAALLAFDKKHMNRLIETHPRIAARCLLNLSRSLCVKLISRVKPSYLMSIKS